MDDKKTHITLLRCTAKERQLLEDLANSIDPYRKITYTEVIRIALKNLKGLADKQSPREARSPIL